jgi:glycosyltransferase involved in cell wall biosynthesis
MKVEIIICTYNRAEKLRKTIYSILNAEIPNGIDVKLIVVDNNSSDDTEVVIKEFSKKTSHIKIKYFFEGKQGKSYALNTALKHMSGDLIAFTDDDVSVDIGWIREMVKALEKYPQYNCFGGKIIAVYPQDIPQWLDIKGSMKFLRSIFGNRDDGDIEIEYGEGTVSGNPGGANMFFRRKVIEENGLFRTDLGPVGEKLGLSEDTDYCQRLIKKGEKFMYIPTAIVYHPVHTERLKKGYLLRWQYKCGRSEVRRNEGYKEVAKVFGIPRYLLRKFITHAAGLSLSLQAKKRFYHKLRFYYTCGELLEHIRFNKSTMLDKNNS